jgi:hypothetical protein
VRGDREEFEAGMRAALVELKTSHTAFYSESPTRFAPQHTINATLSEITVNGSLRWVFVAYSKTDPHTSRASGQVICYWHSTGLNLCRGAFPSSESAAHTMSLFQRTSRPSMRLSRSRFARVLNNVRLWWSPSAFLIA